jgi:hypothetical protein
MVKYISVITKRRYKNVTIHTREVYQRYKAEGICTLCGKNPAIPGQAKCPKCREAFHRYQKKAHDKRRSSGACMDCGLPIQGSNYYCPDCIARRNTYRDQRLAQRKKDNLCIDCGKAIAKDKQVRCEQCLLVRRTKASEWREKGFRGLAKERDGHKCQICDSAQKLVVHHINDDGHTISQNPNDGLDNLITLCRKCHSSLTQLSHTNHVDVAYKLLSIFVR